MIDLSCWENKFKPCCYSEKLVTKLLLLNEASKSKVDILEIKKAIYYAKKYHGSQMRQSGQPYYSHPLEVAYMVADRVFETDILVTSILHDTLEDTELTMGMIDTIFGSVIAEQVEGLTRVKADRKISSAETVKLLCLQGKDDPLVVKYFDRLHNMQTIGAKSQEKRFKVAEETIKQFISLGIYLEARISNMFNADELMVDLCYQQLGVQQNLLQDLMGFPEDNFQLPFLVSQNEKPQN